MECDLCKTRTVVEDAVDDYYEVNDGALDLRFHCFSCENGGSFRMTRHTHVVKALAELSKSMLVSQAVSVEHIFPNQPNNGKLRPDITVRIGGNVYYVDVTVVNPACKSSVDKGSAVTALTAAKHAEAAKRSKYKRVLEASSIAMDRFVPFAIEATGRFGNEALKFFQLLATHSAHDDIKKASYFLFAKRRIRYAILSGNANCKAFFIRNVNVYRSISSIRVEETKAGELEIS